MLSFRESQHKGVSGKENNIPLIAFIYFYFLDID